MQQLHLDWQICLHLCQEVHELFLGLLELLWSHQLKALYQYFLVQGLHLLMLALLDELYVRRCFVKSLNFARVSSISKCFGPEALELMYGRLIDACIEEESSIFAFSAASFNLCNAVLSSLRFMPCVFLNSSIR